MKSKATIDREVSEEKSTMRIPKYVKTRSIEAEKQRLSCLMTYGKEPTASSSVSNKIDERKGYLKRRLEGNRRIEGDVGTVSDRFNELVGEVKMRCEFLDQMDSLGGCIGDSYRPIISTEMSRIVREMKQINLEQTSKLEDSIAKTKSC